MIQGSRAGDDPMDQIWESTEPELGIIHGVRAGNDPMDQICSSARGSSNTMTDPENLQENPSAFRLLGPFAHTRAVLGLLHVLGAGSCCPWALTSVPPGLEESPRAAQSPRDASLASGAICSREQHGGNPSSFPFVSAHYGKNKSPL